MFALNGQDLNEQERLLGQYDHASTMKEMSDLLLHLTSPTRFNDQERGILSSIAVYFIRLSPEHKKSRGS